MVLLQDGVLSIVFASIAAILQVRMFFLRAGIGVSIPMFGVFTIYAFVSNLAFLGNWNIWDHRQLLGTAIEAGACIEALLILGESARDVSRWYFFASSLCFGIALAAGFAALAPQYPGYDQTELLLHGCGIAFCCGTIFYAIRLHEFGYRPAVNHALGLFAWFAANCVALVSPREYWFEAHAFRMGVHVVCIAWWDHNLADVATAGSLPAASKARRT